MKFQVFPGFPDPLAILDEGVFGALLTDVSKAFDCVLHDLIIVKLEAYGFHIDAYKLIHNYLSNRKFCQNQ